jgi:hypothetical protein
MADGAAVRAAANRGGASASDSRDIVEGMACSPARVVSAALVMAASSPFFFQDAARSAAGVPWLWAFLLEDRFARHFLPTSPVVWLLATTVLLGVGALRRIACFIITGWCAANAVVAFVMNFQLYATAMRCEPGHRIPVAIHASRGRGR